MVLTKNELFFQRRILSFSFSIPLSSLRAVGVSDMFMEKPAYGNILVFTYDNPEKGTDKAGFKIPQPDRWLAGIQTFLKT
jgi:hypothetical protein